MTVTPNLPLPAQIDYTSRDFLSLREDMVARVKARIPDWDGEDPTDFGVALVEAFAYMGDLMSYYIDRAANESSLSTATRRASVVAIARDLGYEPAGYTAATGTVQFTNLSEDDVVVPIGTVVTANLEVNDVILNIPFETTEGVTVPAGTIANAACLQGETRNGDLGFGESLGISMGTPSQIFEIPDANVIKESVNVYVYDGVNYFPWQRVEHLADYASLSRVFRVRDTGNNVYYIEFGDGVSGYIPTNGHIIFASYRVVDGTNGNVPAGSIREITSVPGLTSSEVTALVGSLSVTNIFPASGGTDPEELESIRFRASQAYRTNGRAVTLDDYQNIALSLPLCGKASAQSEVPGSVILSVAPYRNTGTAEVRPGFDYDEGTMSYVRTLELDTLKAEVEEAVLAASLAGTSLTVVDPRYSEVTLTVSAEVSPSVRLGDAQLLIKQAILERFDYARMMFGASILQSDIIALVSSLGIAVDITVDNLQRVDDPISVSVLTADQDEILTLVEANLTVAVTGGAEGA